MSILDPTINFSENETPLAGDAETSISVKLICSPYEFELLEGYANNRKGYEDVKHLQPQMAYWYFEEKFPISLSHLQVSLFLCMGLHLHDITYIEEQMKIERQQILTLLRKVMVKFYKYFYDVRTENFDVTLPEKRQVTLEPHAVSVDNDLDDGAREVMTRLQTEAAEKSGKVGILDPESLQQFAVEDREAVIEQALKRCSEVSSSGILGMKSSSKTNPKKRKSSEGTRKVKKRKVQRTILPNL